MIRATVDLGMNDFINFELSFEKIDVQALFKKSKEFYDKYGELRICLFDEDGYFQGLLDVFSDPEPEYINISILPYNLRLYGLKYRNVYAFIR